MHTKLASARADSELARVDRDVQRLEEQWKRDDKVSLAKFWRDCQRGKTHELDEDSAFHLGALIKADLRCHFDRGQMIEINSYLGDFPELSTCDSRVISLIYEEFCLREENGERVDIAAFCHRYPAWKDSLASQLQYHRLFSKAAGLGPSSPSYPEVGGQFEEFRLLALIGKGGSSRVYLASDRSLGDKRVVLKISEDRGEEPKTQGALDHPHIVPVHSVAFDTETSLRGLSMPYRPGLPLDDIQKTICPDRPPHHAKSIWTSLVDGLSSGKQPLSEEQRKALTQSGPSGDGWGDFPIGGTFSQGVAWIGMILARTLDYAHRMKTFHRDVKPGNILLTLQHGPQLLDFNLAESPHAARNASSATLGGTLPYMAPEQIEAFLNPELWNRVGARSDIYSLGLVLRELLTGQQPDLPDDKLPIPRAMQELLDRRIVLVTDVGQFNNDVPFALRSIVDHCLKLDPEDRYPDAQLLADDLERFLRREPLKWAPNPSRREKTVNWMIRNHRGIAAGTVIFTLSAMLIFPWLSALAKPAPAKHPLMQKAATALAEGRAHEAIPLLRELVREYPDQPLPLAVLGIADSLSQGIVENDAQSDVSRGLALPGAEGALLDWGNLHHEFGSQISDFVENQRNALNDSKARRDVPVGDGKAKNGVDAEAQRKQDQVVERKIHETWLKLVNLGLKLDPKSIALRQHLPSIEEYFGRYESADQILGEIIQTLTQRAERKEGLELLDLYNMRNRIAIKWAQSLLQDAKPGDLERATKLADRAAQDFAKLEPFVAEVFTELSVRPSGAQVQSIYSYHWIGSELWLLISQIKQRQQSLEEAYGAGRKADNSLRRLETHANAFMLKQPAAIDDLRARVRQNLRDSKPR